MTVISFADIAAVIVPNEKNVLPDSPGQMATLTEKLTEALGLDAGANEDNVFDAVTAVIAERDQTKADADKADTRSLEDRAKDEGKIVIETGQLTELSDRVTEAEKGLADAEFAKHFDRALGEQRVDAKDETRERYRKLFDQDRETTIALLENQPKLVNDEARGKGGSDEVTTVPDGVDPDSHRLDLEVKTFMKENKIASYPEAFDQVLADKETV